MGFIPVIGFIVTLALILPSLSVTVRRLHDTDRTGWWLLLPIGLTAAGIIVGVVMIIAGAVEDSLGLILLGIGVLLIGSIAGFVALLVFMIQPGDPHPNQYGPDPLQQQAGVAGFRGQGHPYTPPSAPEYNAAPSDTLQEPELADRRYCTQCGMQLQPDAQFCTVCGTAV